MFLAQVECRPLVRLLGDNNMDDENYSNTPAEMIAAAQPTAETNAAAVAVEEPNFIAAGQRTENAPMQALAGSAPTWADARQARTNQHLMHPSVQDSIAAGHTAIADTAAFQRQTEHTLAMSHLANTQYHTGAYYQEAHGIDPADPNYEEKMMRLAAKYPYAKPDAELMRPMHDARETIQKATAGMSQIEAAKEATAQRKEIYAHVGAGNLTEADLHTPGSTYDTLSLQAEQNKAARAAAIPKALDAEEKRVYEGYTGGKLTSLLNASDSDPRAALEKTLWYSARNKILAPLAPAANRSTAAPATSTPLILK
jgi:hypothetical protein